MYNPQDPNVDLDRDYSPSYHSKRFYERSHPNLVVQDHFVQLTIQQTSNLINKHNLKVEPNLRYGNCGDDDRQVVDIYYNESTQAATESPLFVYIHGGYWQLLDKSSSGSMVEPLVRRGYRVAIMDYNLCPTVTLEQLLAQFTNFLQWLFDYAAETQSSCISFAGHSAGAHLLAKLLHASAVVTPERRKLVRSVFFISGIYDLREVWSLQSINPNNILNLNVENAAKLSPMLWDYSEVDSWCKASMHVLVAGHDSVTFVEQSRAFAETLQRSGFTATFKLFENYDHFDIIEETAIDDSDIAKYLHRALQSE